MLKRSHQCKQTSHLNNYIDINKINSQLERANIQKRKLTRNIYSEYELYLNLVRDLLFISVEKGLNQIYSDPTINENFLNENYEEINLYFSEKGLGYALKKGIDIAKNDIVWFVPADLLFGTSDIEYYLKNIRNKLSCYSKLHLLRVISKTNFLETFEPRVLYGVG